MKNKRIIIFRDQVGVNIFNENIEVKDHWHFFDTFENLIFLIASIDIKIILILRNFHITEERNRTQ